MRCFLHQLSEVSSSSKSSRGELYCWDASTPSIMANGLFSCFVILRLFAGEEGRVFWGRYGGIIHNIPDKKIIDVLLHT